MDLEARQARRQPGANRDVHDRRLGRATQRERSLATMRRWLTRADELRLPWSQADGDERRRLSRLHGVYALGAQIMAEWLSETAT